MSTAHATNDAVAIGLIAATIVIASLIAPGMALSNAAQAPFATNLFLRGGMGAGQMALLLALFHPLIKTHWKHIKTTSPKHLLLALAAAALPTLDYSTLSLSMRYIDVSTSTVLVDAWPVFLIPMSALAYRTSNRFRQPVAPTTAATAVCLAWPSLPIRITLALAGALSIATIPFLVRQCEILAQDFHQRSGTSPTAIRQNAALMYLIGTLAVSNLLSATLLSGTAAALTGERIATSHALLWTAYGTIFQSISATAWRTAILFTNRIEIFNLISFLPLASLLWLLTIDRIHVASPALLTAGTAAVIAGNLIANRPR